eukprot:gene39972-biopygen31869
MLGRLVADVFSEVAYAENGLQAVEMVENNGQGYYAAVLMDYQMPVMDGPTSAKNMRAIGFNGVILGVTGNALPADIEYFMSHGVNGVLIKPIVDPDLIVKAVLDFSQVTVFNTL